jgi:polysaccharide export outer membrane protein
MTVPKGFLTATIFFILIANSAAAAEVYQVVPGDVLRIAVFGQNDLDSVARVGEHGAITFNPIGQVSVGALTEHQIERLIATRLQDGGFVNSAKVKVSVEEFNRPLVSVLGHVNRPGEYPIDPDTTVVQMVARAGGMSGEAGDIAVLTRGGQTGAAPISVDLTGVLGQGSTGQNVPVRAGDTIFVPPAPVVYVYGEVNRPGAYRLERSMRVMQAISVAGGITSKGTTRGLTVIRNQGDRSNVMPIEVADELLPNDVVQVKESLF